MYFTSIVTQFARRAGIASSFIRYLSILSARPRLVKSEQPKIYRLEPNKINRLLARTIGCPNQSDRQDRKNVIKSLVSRVYHVLTIFHDAITIKMSTIPPETTRGMKVLNRSAFKTVVDVPTIRVPLVHVGKFQRKVKKHLFKMYSIKPVAELGEDEQDRDQYRLFLFDPEKFKSKEDFLQMAEEAISDFKIDISTWQVVQIEVNYVNWHYDDILRAIVPAELDGVGGFSLIGHILHLNLKNELLPYKGIIGEVLLDKISPVETVVNKTSTIDNTFRNFSMEVLAGKEDFITIAKENGHSFKMDFSKVYWNPRLSMEHQRIVDQLKSGDVMYDVFAGIGPFSVPAAKKRCLIVANDLNPQSYKWLQMNMAINKVKTEPQLYNLDGREFIRNTVKEDLIRRLSDKNFKESLHIVMNLPGLALEFLDAFIGLLSEMDRAQFADVVMPKVHCYTFSKAEDYVEDVRQRTEQIMGCAIPENHTIRIVRNVAPNKEMLCAEFELQKDVLFTQSVQQDSTSSSEEGEPPEKKSRIESL